MLLVLALAAVQACGSESADAVNRPLSSAEVAPPRSFDRVRRTVGEFADRDHFAVQTILNPRRQDPSFSIRLFRDDISVTVNKAKDSPIQIAAFPLCICELGCRAGLQEAEAVAELRQRLSQ